VGITLPGRFDAGGRALQVPNIPGDWAGTPVSGVVSAACRRPVWLINDARAFGVAELRYGAARGARWAAGLVLGTGVGGVLIAEGRVLQGPTGGAGEIGHQVVQRDGPPCGCGSRGCLEALVRADVLAARAGARSVPDAARAARAGHARAREAFDEAAVWIGIGVANVVTLLNPTVVFLGDGVMRSGDLLLPGIRSAVHGCARFVDVNSYSIVAGSTGVWADAIGAAETARRGLAGPRDSPGPQPASRPGGASAS
jgi:glucokinase